MASRKSRTQEDNPKHNMALSKGLSWLLRHHLELVFDHLTSANVEEEIEEAKATGYVDIQAVLKLQKFKAYSLADVQEVVAINDKQRFSIRERPGHPDVLQIRANQGHSIKVAVRWLSLLRDRSKGLDSQFLQTINPELKRLSELSTDIIHGTYHKFWPNIVSSGGLRRMNRNHIHFSKGLPGDKAVISGMRSDVGVLIYIDFEKATKGSVPHPST